LLLNGVAVGGGDLDRTWPINPARASLYCGRDGGSPVSDAYVCPFTFTGTLHRVVLTLGDDQRLDPEAERKAALAED
jgi:arylsulfatase